MGTVYLLGDRDKMDTYKIGSTRGSVEKRMKSLQTGNSGEIYEICHFNTNHPFIMEGFLHRKYNAKKLINEWFLLDKEEVDNFIETCEKIDKQIESLKDNHFFKKKLEK